MPRNVRNFWIEIEVDGRKHKIATGPKSKDGGFTIKVFQCQGGEVTASMKVRGTVTQMEPGVIALTTRAFEGHTDAWPHAESRTTTR